MADNDQHHRIKKNQHVMNDIEHRLGLENNIFNTFNLQKYYIGYFVFIRVYAFCYYI